MKKSAIFSGKNFEKYEMLPPDGGWGYIIALAVSVNFIVALVPISVFGLVFGPFLATLGDTTSATTLIMGFYNTTLFLAGLPANHLLQKYTYRKIGLAGAVIHFSGTFLSLYATSVLHLVITCSVQGFGFGLMYPSAMSAFNEYFLSKQTFMMSIIQVTVGIVGIAWPHLISQLLLEYGFRGTVAISSAFSLNGILAALTLQPSKWHTRKKKIVEEAGNPTDSNEENDFLIRRRLAGDNLKEDTDIAVNINMSTINIAREASPLVTKKSWAESLDLALFKDPVYVNIVIGASMVLISDVFFIHVLPVLVESYGFEKTDITFILTVFFTSDLVGKIILGVISSLCQIQNRYIVLAGSIFTVLFRMVFTLNSSLWWFTAISAILGALRCTIHSTYCLVFCERYGTRFPTAFTLFMVICAVVFLLTGFLTGVVKNSTGSDDMVLYLLTVMCGCCSLSWLLEIVINRTSNKSARK